MSRSSRQVAVTLALLCGCGGGGEGPRTPDSGAASPPDAQPSAPDTTPAPLPDASTPPADARPGLDAAQPADLAGTPDVRAPDAAAPSDQGARPGDAPPAGACPPAPSLDQTWVTPLQTELIARLTGEMEIATGTRIADRASPRNRELARDHLAAAWRALGITPQLHDYGTGVNLHARIESTTGNQQAVLLGAHLDGVANSPAANDNATGVAVVHAVGRHLAQLPCRSRAVILVMFDEEEVGLVGSKQFARKLADERANLHSVHTVDQVGWDRDGDRLFELERPDTGLFELYDAAVRALGMEIPLTITRTTGTDHTSFRPTFLAVGLTEGYRSMDTTPHRHRPTDTRATVDFTYLRTATLLVGRVLQDLVR